MGADHYYDEHPPNPDFDMDHEGHSGWTTQNILSGLSESGEGLRRLDIWLSTHIPDIVLLHVGTNDILKCEDANGIVARIREMVAIARSTNPSSTILVSTLIPLGSAQRLGFDDRYCSERKGLNGVVEEFNQRLEAALSKIAQVELVDANRGFDPERDLYDGIHPNASGERKIAEAWFFALIPILSRTSTR
jgi:acyl-CoA thioesterase I